MYGEDAGQAWSGFQSYHDGNLNGYLTVKGNATAVERLLKRAHPEFSAHNLKRLVLELSINPPKHLTFFDCQDIAEAVGNGYSNRVVASWYGVSDAYVKRICVALAE